MKGLTLRLARSRRLRDTRPATAMDHWLTVGGARPAQVAFSFRYARGLFEWTPFWGALVFGRQDRRFRG